MSKSKTSVSSLNFDTFGNLLRYLRKRAQLTQRELAIAVGYSEAHISRLETNERIPDLSTLAALFVPVLELQEEPETIAQLLELAAIARGGNLSAKTELMLVQSIEKEVAQSFESVPSNLPLQLTSFIGRETEIEEIRRLLSGEEKVRLLTLFGAGGCGKTRLALQAAEQLVLDFPQGVWFVDLAPLTDPGLIPRTMASSLGLPETPAQETIKSLIAWLSSRKILIVFDNCEHILNGVAVFVESILSACPQVQVIATSREVLNIPGERQYFVPPLAYPPEGLEEKSSIANFASVLLFIQRARNAQTLFDLTHENAADIAQICRRLDGIPLAIELAAARVGLLRVQQIRAQLKDRFHLLTSGNRTLPRHQTLRAMIDWSHDLLSEEEHRLFRLLSVFRGGWTLDAASSVSKHGSEISTLDLLSRLRDKSFIVVERQPGKEARYTMLETLREYAFEKLVSTGETMYAREQHFEFFHQLALRSRLYGPEKQVWLDRLEADYENIRAAVNWALDNRDSEAAQPYVEESIELVLALADFFWFRGYTGEAREWMDQFLAIDMPASRLRALLLQKSGWYARSRGDFKKADMLLLRALEMAKEIGDLNRASWALGDLGLSTRDQGDNQQAIRYFTEGLSFARQSGEARAIGVHLYSLAESYEQIRDLEKARDFREQGLKVFRQEADKTHIAWGLEGLAGVAYLANDLEGALKFHLESLRIKVEVMDRLGIAYSFEGLAQLAAAVEEPERAAVLWGAAAHLRETMTVVLEPSREEIYASLIPRTRAQIGDNRFEEFWDRGKRMELKDAIEYALNPS